MRETKSRAGDNREKCWTTNFLIAEDEIYLELGIPCAHERIKLMQYTDLKYKNGKEIYEGDIVIQEYFAGDKKEEVKFDGGMFYSGFHVGSSTKKGRKAINSRIKVIGNIHQNPEMLSRELTEG